MERSNSQLREKEDVRWMQVTAKTCRTPPVTMTMITVIDTLGVMVTVASI